MIENTFFMRFDRSSFKSFYFAANELNFTRAAKIAGTTQSGISQHVAKLETELDSSLFLRAKGNLQLTDTGKMLKNYLENIFQAEEEFLGKINTATTELSGTVNYSMPGSCLMSPHFGMMLETKKKEFKNIDLKVEIENSERVVDKVLKGESDFGFITREIEHPQIMKVNFCQENYVLLTSNSFKLNKRKVTELNFINHPDFYSLYETWYKQNFKKKLISPRKLNYSGETNRIAAALSMVTGDLGVTILPEHCAMNLTKNKSLKISKDFKPAIGTIHIIHRNDITMPKRVEKVINTFLSFYQKSLH